ncbi:MAG: hypothetical protein HY321_18535 [Armatimonadetes bacterium]|nr:hypothetical protein [Armatimonadota bacterium]
MKLNYSRLIAATSAPLLLGVPLGCSAATEDLGDGFLHHGVAVPVSSPRGIIATVDGQGRNVVLLWLFDQRGGYGLLMLDAETGKSEEFPMPFPSGGYCVYSSVLSSDNKLYTFYNRHFTEFDPVKRAFTFTQRTAEGRVALSMTEDDNGVIWTATNPRSDVVSFNPKTRELREYPEVNRESWPQSQSSIAADDAGWVYFGVGNAAAQIVAFDPRTGTGKGMLPEDERVTGTGTVYRDLDGRVYGRIGYSTEDGWYRFYRGQGEKIGKHPVIRRKPIITANQGLFHRDFPDGKRIKTCDLVERLLVIEDPKSGETKEHHFDYASEGAPIMSVAAAPDGTVCGATAAPMHFFRYDPKRDELVNRPCYRQWNTLARQGDRFFAGCYSRGSLLEWDPSQPWVATEPGNPNSNPLLLTECAPTIIRPSQLLAHPDGKTLVLTGITGYGRVGAGLLFWDRETRTPMALQHTDVLANHATVGIAALPGGKLLGGTGIDPKAPGENMPQVAELYLMDMATKRVEWREAVLPGVIAYRELLAAPDGLVYGIIVPARFFVFDPAQRKVIHEEDLGPAFGAAVGQQGSRAFVVGPDKTVYVLLAKGIVRVEPGTFRATMVAPSPVPIATGGDILDGRIYFASTSHLYSYRLPE